MKDLSEVLGHCSRQSAVNVLKQKANQLVRRGQQLLALASAIEEIEKSATQGHDGEGRHPYVGAGSDAEEALWELVVSYKG